MKKLFTFLLLISMTSLAFSQTYPLKTIREIQEVSAAMLATCNDTSLLHGDTVTVRGVVVMDGGQAFSANGHQVWIRDSTSAWGGLDVRDGESNGEVANLIAGDSVEIVGVVEAFRGETQLNPLDGGVMILGSGRPIDFINVDLSEINDMSRINLPAGEKWEGVYVEITNVEVLFLDGSFSGGTRQHFTVVDENGYQIEIQDRFPAGRSNLDVSNGGLLQIPEAGVVFDTLRGVIGHGDPNGDCALSGFPAGYVLFPFLSSDIVLAESDVNPPSIFGIDHSPLVPMSTDDVTITATIEDSDGSISAATLFYAVGIDSDGYTELAMTSAGGSTYSATIPNTAFNDGDLVKYYICATDDEDLTKCQPDVPDGDTPEFFNVRDNGLQIFDLQFTINSDGNSPYVGNEVTVEGVVTSSAEAGNLNLVTIQQEDNSLTGWAGIELAGDAALASLTVGQKVSVTGTITEPNGLTLLTVSSVNVTGTGTIEPLEVDPAVFSSPDFATNEQYEGMLVRLVNPAGGPVYVVDVNADGPPNNFAEYRIGTDVFDPNSGSRLLAGRKTGSAPGSLNVSYINDSTWVLGSGVLEVPACVVSYEDSMDYVQGIMHFSFSQFKLLPRNNDDYGNFMGACNATTGIEEELAGSQFKVYPNPVSESLQVEYSFPRLVSGEIVLMDMMGRKLQRQAINGTQGELQLPVHQLAAGAYVMIIAVDGTVIKHDRIIVGK